MAFDGVTIAGLTAEFKNNLIGGRIYKIAQPEPDELILTIRAGSGQYRLLISAGASLPLIYLTDENKPSPVTAPNFCMLLRKHIQNGRITKIWQPSLERCIRFEIEHLDELGDLRVKTIIVELMGKYSNIIFCDDNNTIIDSIKRVSQALSSVREVLPGREYFLPDASNKHDPLLTDEDEFREVITASSLPLGKAIYSVYTGISPLLSEDLLFSRGVDSAKKAEDLTENEWTHLYRAFSLLTDDIRDGNFAPVIYQKDGAPVEFSAVPLYSYAGYDKKEYDSVSEMVRSFYSEKELHTRIRQKSTDLRRIVQTALERTSKKYDLQTKQMKDTAKRDKYRIYGELLNTYGYSAEPEAKSIEVTNYYDGKLLTIPLDPTKTASENAQNYFNRYNKLKRTYEALTTQLAETSDEIAYLESVSNFLETAKTEAELSEIKEELRQTEYIRHRAGEKRSRFVSKPYHYISSDGFDIFVGKNNTQNDTLTFKIAEGGDWWFHAKQTPGSHVIVKCHGAKLPDATFEEAARLAAFYSKGRGSGKVEIDYVLKKELRKPNGAKPGFVIYHTNYSMTASADITGIQEADE